MRKPYYGSNILDQNDQQYRYCTLEEAVQKGKVARYGLIQVTREQMNNIIVDKKVNEMQQKINEIKTEYRRLTNKYIHLDDSDPISSQLQQMIERNKNLLNNWEQKIEQLKSQRVQEQLIQKENDKKVKVMKRVKRNIQPKQQMSQEQQETIQRAKVINSHTYYNMLPQEQQEFIQLLHKYGFIAPPKSLIIKDNGRYNQVSNYVDMLMNQIKETTKNTSQRFSQMYPELSPIYNKLDKFQDILIGLQGLDSNKPQKINIVKLKKDIQQQTNNNLNNDVNNNVNNNNVNNNNVNNNNVNNNNVNKPKPWYYKGLTDSQKLAYDYIVKYKLPFLDKLGPKKDKNNLEIFNEYSNSDILLKQINEMFKQMRETKPQDPNSPDMQQWQQKYNELKHIYNEYLYEDLLDNIMWQIMGPPKKPLTNMMSPPIMFPPTFN